MTNNLISVVMAVYNEPLNQIKLSLESILNQTNKNFEFIIICIVIVVFTLNIFQ